VIVDPTAEDRRFHRNGPRLGQSLHPAVQLASGRSDFAFPVDLTTRVLHSVADRPLVYVQSDIAHTRHRGSLHGRSLNQHRRWVQLMQHHVLLHDS
jgi:hypothetical protein